MIDDGEELCLELPSGDGLSLIQTIDLVRQLRDDADEEERSTSYDPQDFMRRRVDAMRRHADAIEKRMEERIGWSR